MHLKHMASKVKDLCDVENEISRAMWKRNGTPKKEAVERRLSIKWKEEIKAGGDKRNLKPQRIVKDVGSDADSRQNETGI